MRPDLFLIEPGAKICLFDGMSIVRFWVALCKVLRPPTVACRSRIGNISQCFVKRQKISRFFCTKTRESPKLEIEIMVPR